MNNARTLKTDFETIAWGTIFIWWGVTEFNLLPHGAGAAGIGLILLGLNVARWRNGIPTRGLTTTLGILAFAWGGLDLARPLLHLPFELPTFAILLIVLGVIVLAQTVLNQKPVNKGAQLV